MGASGDSQPARAAGPTKAARGANFTPQIRRVRADGWTAERQRVFFEHLCATCNVKFSAAQAQIGSSGAYEKRRIDPVFRERWRLALDEGYVRIEAMLIARAGGTADAAALVRAAAAEATGDAGALPYVTEALDTQLALQLLTNHRRVVHGGTRKGGPGLRPAATQDELANAILKQLDALKRRRGGAG